MSPTAVIERLLHVNRPVAVVILSGIGLAAAAAIIGAWTQDVETALRIGAYAFGLGALATVIARIVSDSGVLGAMILWFVTLLVIASVVVFFVSAIFPRQTPFPPVECLARFWLKCEEVEDNVAARNAPAVEVEESVPPVPSATVPNFGDFRVFVQFAGYNRETIIEMARTLSGAGWRVEGGARGGERIGSAAGKAEIRFRSDAEEAAARALAAQIVATGVKPEVAVRRMEIIRPGTLEVWIGL